MGRGRRQPGYRAIDPRQAVDLSPMQPQPQQRLTPEQEEKVEKLMKRKARNQLSVAFMQSLIQGRAGEDLDAAAVASQAHSLAAALLDESERRDAEDPIDLEGLQV